MERVAVAAALVVIAVIVARLVERRRPAAPTQPRWPVPTQLDRDDFEGGERPWLVAVFTSTACESCGRATAQARVLESPSVACQDVSYQERPDLHERYGVEAVPTTVLADAEGVVRVSFVGVSHAAELWAAVAEAREAETREAEER